MTKSNKIGFNKLNSQEARELNNSQSETKNFSIYNILKNESIREKIEVMKLLKYEKSVENLYNEYRWLVDWLFHYEEVIDKCSGELKKHYQNELLETIKKIEIKTKYIDDLTNLIKKQSVFNGKVIFNSKFTKGGNQ